MDQVKTYRLGNQLEEYELSEQYLGWKPVGFASWAEYCDQKLTWKKFSDPEPVTLVSPNSEEKVTLKVDHWISKDAFPLHFFGEERAVDWWRFLIVSQTDTPDIKFIIPMH